MPATLIMDEIDGAELQTSLDGIHRRVRAGRIRGINTTGSVSNPDPRVLEKALAVAGMPGLGDAYPPPVDETEGPTVPGLKLKHHILRPFTNTVTKVFLVYETEQNQFTPGSFLLSDDTRTFSETTNMIPGTRTPVRLNWTNPDDPNEFVPEDFAVFKYERSVRSMVILATIYGNPPTIQRDMVGTVNDNDWGGYPRGYWKVDRYRTESRDRGSSYQVTAEVSTKKNEDWSVYDILQNKHTGQYVPIPDSYAQELVDEDYIYGYTGFLNRGIVKIGPYALSPFDILFGFTDIPG